jgi:hypothetical protein
VKKSLPNVTLLGLDCVDIDRLKVAADICQKHFEFGAVKLLSSISDTDPRVVPIENIDSIEKYSHFFVKKLHNFIETDFVLVIQHDGFILNPEAWTDDFLAYDYIGAPWWYEDDNNVGNGGFSLRSKKLLNILYHDDSIREHHPEDHHIARTYGDYLRSLGIIFAPEHVASKFSIEGCLKEPVPVKYGSVWTNEFGFHGLDETDISAWVTLHPEYAVDRVSKKLHYSNGADILTV